MQRSFKFHAARIQRRTTVNAVAIYIYYYYARYLLASRGATFIRISCTLRVRTWATYVFGARYLLICMIKSAPNGSAVSIFLPEQLWTYLSSLATAKTIRYFFIYQFWRGCKFCDRRSILRLGRKTLIYIRLLFDKRTCIAFIYTYICLYIYIASNNIESIVGSSLEIISVIDRS